MTFVAKASSSTPVAGHQSLALAVVSVHWHTIIVAAGGETLCVTLQQMGLLDLAAVGQASHLDAEVVFGVVGVGRDLTPVARDGGDVSDKLGLGERRGECDEGHRGEHAGRERGSLRRSLAPDEGVSEMI